MKTYKYEVYDALGRLWAKTLTHIKAVRLAKEIEQTKNIRCIVVELKEAV